MESDQMESRMSMRSLFDMLLRSYTYYSSPRLMDFDSDVSAVEVLKRIADDLMAVREAQLCMEMMAERDAWFSMLRLMDFSSSVKKVVVSDDKDLVKSPDDLMAERIARLRMLRRQFCPFGLFHIPSHFRWVDFDSDVSAVKDFNKLLDDLMAVRRSRLRMLRWGDFSSSEKKLVVSAVEKWIKSLDDQRAERRAQLCMKRWVDFGSDVSAVKDFNKLLDDLMAVRRAWLRMERRAPCCHFGPCPCDDFHIPFHPRRVNFEKEHNMSDDEDWIKSSDDLEMNQELSSEVGWKHG